MLKLLTDMNFPGALDAALQGQPAGFDLTCAQVTAFKGTGVLDFTNKNRRLPETKELAWEAIRIEDQDVEQVQLDPGGYLVTYGEEISVPSDCAGLVLPRSSLMRMGATLHSALWDPGYSGRGQGLLTVHNPLTLHHRARIGQFVLIMLESAASKLYAGTYQGENL
jgi:deoxycytidine triphosphate deaminase